VLKSVNNIDIKIPGLKILSKIGEGGMSVVYLAEQISLKREVAVKVMRLEIASNDLDVQRFKHEAKTIASLDHPNIINIYNIGQTSKGEIYFTMPFLNHGDFSNYLLEDEFEFIQLLKSVCDGLSFAHDRGVVHRDIKPENLLFDKFGNVRIADFGIAISKDGTRMTKEHQIVGSAQYMSPEQARSLKVDVHSDIYSLGIVIYERLTGEVPFDADDSISILVDHVSTEAPKLPTKMRHWQNLIDKCLAKLPVDRFQSMVELKIALDKIPVNSLQRTNSVIQKVLSDEKGKHLKWFVPILLLLLIIAVYAVNQADEQEPVNDKSNNGSLIAEHRNAEKPATDNNAISQPKAVVMTDVSTGKDQANDIAVTDSSTDLTINPVTDTVTQQQEDTIPELTQEATVGQTGDLSIEEIKRQLKGQQQSAAEVLLSAEDGMDITEQLPTSDTTETIDVELILSKAMANIEKYQLSKPRDNNATDQLLQVLSIEPENQQAITGLQSVGGKYFRLIESALKKADFNTALKHSRSLNTFNQKTNFANPKYEVQKDALLTSIAAIDVSADTVSAEQVNTLARVINILAPEHALMTSLNDLAKSKSGPQVGEKLLDERGIESILLTPNLAVTTTEITVENYAEFVKATNRNASKCKHKGGGVSIFTKNKSWDKPFFSQGQNHPVVCVSWDDASAYARWLSEATGKRYRLPAKTEWLMLAAVDKNTFSACKTANVTGNEAKKIRNKEDKYSCSDKFKFTAPVASFRVNSHGLYDVQGNVSEWIACEKIPCQAPVAMGSSWLHGKQSNKLQRSEKLKANSAFTYLGFRLVRDL
jgi:serine/threonine protein kinase